MDLELYAIITSLIERRYAGQASLDLDGVSLDSLHDNVPSDHRGKRRHAKQQIKQWTAAPMCISAVPTVVAVQRNEGGGGWSDLLLVPSKETRMSPRNNSVEE